MPCTRPIKGYRGVDPSPSTGKHPIVFSARDGADLNAPVDLPCGICDSCKLSRARVWALRCMLEASLWDDNRFITLTYNDDNLPFNGSIQPEDVVLFMKRLREFYGPGIRSFGCAEYGDKFARPHYHILLFNHRFPDEYFFKERRGELVYRSPKLEELWPFGHSEIGSVTDRSAAYVARYINKKVGKREDPSHYEVVHPETGEVLPVLPERLIAVSRRPGIAAGWFELFGGHPKDFIEIGGVKYSPPAYFDRKLEVSDPDEFRAVKKIRSRKGVDYRERNRDIDWRTEEVIVRHRLEKLVRGYEK